jgi:hypothetical protein
MSRLTVRLSDEKHRRRRQLAEARQISVSALIDELMTGALAVHDVELRFRDMAASGNRDLAVRLLDRLDVPTLSKPCT